MRKILISCLVVPSLLVVKLPKVSAKVLSWDQVCEKFLLTIQEDATFKTVKTADKLVISYTEDDFIYELALTYKDNIVSYINTRDISKLSDEEKLSTIILDQTFLEAFNINIIGLYDNTGDIEKVFEILETLKTNGAIITEGGEYYNTLSTTSSDELNLDADIIKSYQIDLVKVDELLGSKTDSNETNSLENNKTEINDEKLDSNKDEVNLENLNLSKGNSNVVNVENPKTLDISNCKYIIFAVLSLVCLCGLISNFITKAKEAK